MSNKLEEDFDATKKLVSEKFDTATKLLTEAAELVRASSDQYSCIDQSSLDALRKCIADMSIMDTDEVWNYSSRNC